MVASVPWQLRSSSGLEEREDVAAPGAVRRGAPDDAGGTGERP
jgi:hypothetical protein